MKMKTEKIIKEIGIYILAFVSAYIFYYGIVLSLNSKSGHSIVEQYLPSEHPARMIFTILFLPPFLISFFIVYKFTKNVKKSFLISIVTLGLIVISLAIEGYTSALR